MKINKKDEMKKVEIVNEEVVKDQVEVNNEDSNLDSKKEEIVINIKDQLKNDIENIHDKYKDLDSSSFIYEEIRNNIQEIKKDRKSDSFELFMMTYKSREIYYLFLIDKEKNESHFLMKNDSIMKNKVFSLRLIQDFNEDSIKIVYHKKDREKDSSEIIKKNSKEYNDKKEKYMI